MRADTIIFFVLDYHYRDGNISMSEMNGIMISGAFTDQDSNGFPYKNNGVYTYHPAETALDNVGSNAFGLYYDEDEDGRYGPVGSQQLTDYHYHSSGLVGYVSGSWWNRGPANSQGIFVGIVAVTDTDISRGS